MPITRSGPLILALAALATPALADPPPHVPAGYELVYEQDFDRKTAIADLAATDASAWRIGKEKNGNGYLEQFRKSDYEYPVRSPFNIGLIDGLQVRSFVLDAALLQTSRDYGHRDMCVFFGFRDPTHFYYAHIAAKTDPHAHNLFIVNDEPRTKISDTTTEGHDWGRDVWHHVRLVRDAEAGTMALYVNDMSEPIMTATDKTFGWGYVGFGSFDDTGRVDNVRLWAPAVRKQKAPFFERKGD